MSKMVILKACKSETIFPHTWTIFVYNVLWPLNFDLRNTITTYVPYFKVAQLCVNKSATHVPIPTQLALYIHYINHRTHTRDTIPAISLRGPDWRDHKAMHMDCKSWKRYRSIKVGSTKCNLARIDIRWRWYLG